MTFFSAANAKVPRCGRGRHPPALHSDNQRRSCTLSTILFLKTTCVENLVFHNCNFQISCVGLVETLLLNNTEASSCNRCNAALKANNKQLTWTPGFASTPKARPKREFSGNKAPSVRSSIYP